MKCPHCQAGVRDGDVHCWKCGGKLGKEAELEAENARLKLENEELKKKGKQDEKGGTGGEGGEGSGGKAPDGKPLFA